MKEFKLNKTDIDGIAIPIKDSRPIEDKRVLLVDRYGFQLFNKHSQNGSYGWRWSESIGYHRVVKWMPDGRSIKKYITFQRDLLELPGTIPICFRNNDRLDLRVCNLLVCRGKYPAIYWINILYGDDYGIKFDIPPCYSVY